jgi:hypothetical protein
MELLTELVRAPKERGRELYVCTVYIVMDMDASVSNLKTPIHILSNLIQYPSYPLYKHLIDPD